MARPLKILLLGGDGIGPEVVAAALPVLERAASLAGLSLDLQEDLLHGACWDRHGCFCREETVADALAADALLVGAVGGPKWDGITVPGGPEMQDGLMRLRLALDAYIGIRPARAWPGLEPLTPYRPDLLTGADVLILREMCGGVYFAQPRGLEQDATGQRRAFDTTAYSEAEIRRIARAGFQLARARRGRLTSIDKANVMTSGVLWRQIVTETAAEFPDVTLQHLYADNAVYQLARNPRGFDVILGDNLFGDILSDQAGVLAGSLGMLPSACLPAMPAVPGGRVSGIYEAVHGSAPDIAGQGIANPLGTILSVALMAEYSFARPDIARRIEAAVEQALTTCRTPDLGGRATTAEMTEAVLQALG